MPPLKFQFSLFQTFLKREIQPLKCLQTANPRGRAQNDNMMWLQLFVKPYLLLTLSLLIRVTLELYCNWSLLTSIGYKEHLYGNLLFFGPLEQFLIRGTELQCFIVKIT